MKPYRVLFIEEKPYSLTKSKALIETHLKQLFPLELLLGASLELLPPHLDLIFFEKNIADREQAHKILLKTMHDLRAAGELFLPVIFISTGTLAHWNHLAKLTALPWYFDLINPAHMDSLPIRVANLCKIREHLLQLQNYQDEMRVLHQRIDEIEIKLEQKKHI